MLDPKLCAAALALLTCGLAASSGSSLQEAPRPTAQHEWLTGDVGTWDGAVSMYIMPGMEPMHSDMVEEVKMFGPYWQVSEMTGDFGGMPFLGRGQVGYDPEKKKFIGTWIDNMGSTLSVMEGTYDEQKDVLHMEYEGPDMTGRMTKQWNNSTHDDQGRRVSKGYMEMPDGSQHMWMEIVYTRRVEEPEREDGR